MRTRISLIFVTALSVCAAAQTVTGSGTAGYVPVFTSSSVIGNSSPSIFEGAGNVGIGTTTPGNALSVAGVINAGGNYYNVLTWSNDGHVQNGVKITTNIPFTNNAEMPTVMIEGYDYGAKKPIGLIMNWYIESGGFVSEKVASYGAYTPQIKLSEENGNVVIFINDLPYFQRFMIRAYANGLSESPSWFNGWSASDAALNANDSPIAIVPYENDFAGNVYLPNGVWNTSGNVGIGTTNPGAMLEVNGGIKLTRNSGGSITFQDGTTQSTAANGVCGGDYAESIDVTGDRAAYAPGDVLVLNPQNPGKFLKSAEAYSTSVSGIYSTRPGMLGRRQLTPKSDAEVPMAMVGIAPTKVSNENGPIKVGDLLVSSSTPGYAMKGTDRNRMLGAVIGKAMGTLDSDKGVIEVLVTLQ